MTGLETAYFMLVGYIVMTWLIPMALTMLVSGIIILISSVLIEYVYNRYKERKESKEELSIVKINS